MNSDVSGEKACLWLPLLVTSPFVCLGKAGWTWGREQRVRSAGFSLGSLPSPGEARVAPPQLCSRPLLGDNRTKVAPSSSYANLVERPQGVGNGLFFVQFCRWLPFLWWGSQHLHPMSRKSLLVGDLRIRQIWLKVLALSFPASDTLLRSLSF